MQVSQVPTVVSHGTAEAQHKPSKESAAPTHAEGGATDITAIASSSRPASCQRELSPHAPSAEITIPELARPFSRLGQAHASKSSDVAPLPMLEDRQESRQHLEPVPATHAAIPRHTQAGCINAPVLHPIKTQALAYCPEAATTPAEAQATQLHQADTSAPLSPDPATGDATGKPTFVDAAVSPISPARIPRTAQAVLAPGAGPVQFLQVPLLMVPPGYIPMLQQNTIESRYARLEQIPLRLQKPPDTVLNHVRKRYRQASSTAPLSCLQFILQTMLT